MVQTALSPLSVSGLARFILGLGSREIVSCLSACERGESARPETARRAVQPGPAMVIPLSLVPLRREIDQIS